MIFQWIWMSGRGERGVVTLNFNFSLLWWHTFRWQTEKFVIVKTEDCDLDSSLIPKQIKAPSIFFIFLTQIFLLFCCLFNMFVIMRKKNYEILKSMQNIIVFSIHSLKCFKPFIKDLKVKRTRKNYKIKKKLN